VAMILLAATIAQGADPTATRIPLVERDALIALYVSTGGDGWIRHDRWLGPAGTECTWYGIVCGRTVVGGQLGPLSVTDIDLQSNRLTGTIPNELALLDQLVRLRLEGNDLRRSLPQALRTKWDAGFLEVKPTLLLHDIDSVRLEATNPATLCSGFSVKVSVGGGVTYSRPLCDKSGETTWCEVRQGRTHEFDRVARLLDADSAAQTTAPNQHSRSDVSLQLLTIRRAGEKSAETIRWQGAGTLRQWTVTAVLSGILRGTEWEPGSKRAKCPPDGTSEAR